MVRFLRDARITPPFFTMNTKFTKLFNAETSARWILRAAAALNIVFVILICGYLVASGLPATFKIGIGDFFFNTRWASTATPPSFGILPFILTSFYGTTLALAIGLPIGFFTAVYIASFAVRPVKRILGSAVDLLAGIPSVVYGLVGMLTLVPWIQDTFDEPDGSGLLAASLVLALMILPTIVKVSVNAIESVPKDYALASLALGANKTETVFRVLVPAAKSGIAAAAVLGVGRALGEAMAVMMVAGNAPNMPGLFESVRFLTTAVASEMSYSTGLQREALFSIALVLFFFILGVNALLNAILKRGNNYEN